VARDLAGSPSCPECGAPAAAAASRCGRCGYAFYVDASPGAPRRRRGSLAILAAVAIGVAATVALLTAGGGEAPRAERRGSEAVERPPPDLLSRRPLSAREAERRLEARFTSLRDDDTASVRCSRLIPKPAHAIRFCEIRYPSGSERTVIVMTNPQGREVLIERP
jgi:hypothetical protein